MASSTQFTDTTASTLPLTYTTILTPSKNITDVSDLMHLHFCFYWLLTSAWPLPTVDSSRPKCAAWFIQRRWSALGIINTCRQFYSGPLRRYLSMSWAWRPLSQTLHSACLTCLLPICLYGSSRAILLNQNKNIGWSVGNPKNNSFLFPPLVSEKWMQLG